jgi:hypothetical protein
MTPCLADERAKYQIRVQGRLEPLSAARLGDLTLVVHESEQNTITDLSGWIGDQAALMGVLEQLYALGLPLLSVERLKRTWTLTNDPDESDRSRPRRSGDE